MNNLRIINDNEKIKILLDDLEVKCVESYELKSCSTIGIAELNLKIIVKTAEIDS